MRLRRAGGMANFHSRKKTKKLRSAKLQAEQPEEIRPARRRKKKREKKRERARAEYAEAIGSLQEEAKKLDEATKLIQNGLATQQLTGRRSTRSEHVRLHEVMDLLKGEVKKEPNTTLRKPESSETEAPSSSSRARRRQRIAGPDSSLGSESAATQSTEEGREDHPVPARGGSRPDEAACEFRSLAQYLAMQPKKSEGRQRVDVKRYYGGAGPALQESDDGYLSRHMSRAFCVVCRCPDHRAYECPEVRCWVCYEKGHEASVCPNRWTKCERCGRKGHQKDQCLYEVLFGAEREGQWAGVRCVRCGEEGHPMCGGPLAASPSPREPEEPSTRAEAAGSPPPPRARASRDASARGRWPPSRNWVDAAANIRHGGSRTKRLAEGEELDAPPPRKRRLGAADAVAAPAKRPRRKKKAAAAAAAAEVAVGPSEGLLGELRAKMALQKGRSGARPPAKRGSDPPPRAASDELPLARSLRLKSLLR